MKKLIATASVALVGVFGLAGCASDTPAPAPSTVTVTAPPTEVLDPATTTPENPLSPADIVFLDTVKSHFPGVAQEDLINGGHVVCNGLDAGEPVVGVVEDLINAGFPSYEAGYFLGASVTAYCPDHTDAVKEFISAYGDNT